MAQFNERVEETVLFCRLDRRVNFVLLNKTTMTMFGLKSLKNRHESLRLKAAARVFSARPTVSSGTKKLILNFTYYQILNLLVQQN